MNTAIAILENKPAIERLFLKYGIISPVTVENVDLALKEESSEFQQELEMILQSSIINYDGTENNRSQNAMNWVNTLLQGGAGITSAVVANRNQGQNNPGAMPNVIVNTPQPERDSTNTKIIILIVVAIVVGIAVYLYSKNQ